MSDKAARLLLRPAEVAESLGIGRRQSQGADDKLTDWIEQGATGSSGCR